MDPVKIAKKEVKKTKSFIQPILAIAFLS
jgi:hypothetical protein